MLGNSARFEKGRVSVEWPLEAMSFVEIEKSLRRSR